MKPRCLILRCSSKSVTRDARDQKIPPARDLTNGNPNCKIGCHYSRLADSLLTGTTGLLHHSRAAKISTNDPYDYGENRTLVSAETLSALSSSSA